MASDWTAVHLHRLGFNFYPGGHRVARSEWELPCIPYENTGANRKGFFSGVFNPQTITLPVSV